ncbi:zinc-binding metallopeptidase family protein [Alteromonas gilva]|uniref:Zinc-binding metallopeptidase n=1 Tax=Alteromonas gilva TaxID=2987522 RepID=A0ABT5L1Z1_9ALTE|nr:putative zinc-binding metallopeptidase [Alteromonas gilva]MDC8831061.1 putative zinc-binding metallopeptidase [Alteromonas gilva]
MKTYTCQCGNTLYFANSLCLTCQRPVGFLSDAQVISSCDIDAEGHWIATVNGRAYRQCRNYAVTNICNWLIPQDKQQALCDACALTDTIPDQSKPDNKTLWFRMEQAKRHLLYTLYKLKLPVVGKRDAPDGMSFRFLEDQEEALFGRELTVKNSVITGHSDGVITINIKEAEASKRLEMREMMNERYRTLIGHFRHESGHYYWDKLVKNSAHLDDFRQLFGDERQDYQKSLERYYAEGPAKNWYQQCISAYASMHPWEDWAETWAHYLHMVDTLETAHEYQTSLENITLSNPLIDEYPYSPSFNEKTFDTLLDDWDKLTTLLNALNRSMGLDDAYPFVLTPPAREKLHFIHLLVRES